MSKYHRVLIPIDLKRGTAELTPAVRRIVDTGSAEITLMHVVESRPWLGRNGHTMRVMAELERFADRHFRGARVSRRIEWGRPANCILDVIRSARADVVLLSAGHAPLAGSALGPVSTEVLAEATCPVLLEWGVMAPVTEAQAPVCCAIEFDGGEERVLEEAAWAASHLDVPLKVICALVPRGSRKGLLWDPASREHEVDLTRSRIGHLCDNWAPGADVQVGVGLPVSVFSRAIRFHGAGLVVTGGSQEALLAAESECPVLYVGPALQSRAGRPEALEPAEFAGRKSA